MIGYLSGDITLKTPTYIYVECQGVGYHVHISLYTYSKIEGLSKARIFTHMQVREDDISLYGFFDEMERSMFVHLISVSGVGTNTARVILSSMSVEEIRYAIIQENEALLSKIKGIGPKTAKRIILDLKDKLMKQGLTEGLVVEPGTEFKPVGGHAAIKDEALSALQTLGYTKAIAEKQILQVLKVKPEISQVEELLKHVLKQINS